VLGERAGADDVLQESAMIALGKLAQFDPDTNFTAWMGRIVRFVALNHARRRIKTTASSVDPHAMDITTQGAHGAAANGPILNGRGELFAGQETFDDRVLAALRGLEETPRACLLLRTILEMPYREISLALDIAEGTAMSHVHRARASLRERLSAPATRLTTEVSGDLESHGHGRE
jgi:RNA polymerase sigma-70 factor (ECF subfamily)